MTASQNVIIELKNLGINMDIQPTKLKAGCGEEVCQVLLKLTQISLKNKFRFKKCAIKEEGAGVEDDGEDMDNEMEGGADLADVIHAQESDEEIDEDLDLGGGNIQ